MKIGSKIPIKPKEYTSAEIKIRAEFLRFKDCYIFVNTNFKRTTEPIHVLAFCEGKRNIPLDKNSLIFKSNGKVFSIISNIIKQHYIDTQGNIGIWGDIVNYVYHHNDCKTYVFNKDGQMQKKPETVVENRAVLKLKNKELKILNDF